MAEFTSHNPGTFSWPELSTTDQKAGPAFYSALFGWEVNDIPMGPAGTYTMFQRRGKAVAAAAAQPMRNARRTGEPGVMGNHCQSLTSNSGWSLPAESWMRSSMYFASPVFSNLTLAPRR